MTTGLLELGATLRRRHVLLGAGAFTIAALLVTIRSRTGLFSIDASVLAYATVDDQSRYLAIVAAGLLGAEAGGSWYTTGRAAYAWASGVRHEAQLGTRLGVAAALGALVAALYWFLRIVGAVIAFLLNDRALGFTGGPVPVEITTTWRVGVAAIVAAVLGALVGGAVRRPLAAMGLTFLLVASLVPLTNMLVIRAPDVAPVQSLLPGGALTTLLESNAGPPRASGRTELLAPRSAFLGAVILAGWAFVLYAIARVGGAYRAQGRVTSVRRRVLTAGGIALTIVVLIGLVVPPLARGALPWHLKPEWVRQEHDNTTSLDAVERFVDGLYTNAPGAFSDVLPEDVAVDVGDAFWQPLLSADDVTIGPVSRMPEPGSVPVVVDLAGTEGGGHVVYWFALVLVADRWQIREVSASFRTDAR